MESMERLNNARVCVTGGTGFIGSHLIEELLKAGVEVVVPYIEIDKHSIFYLHNLSEKVTAESCDITDKLKITDFLKKHKVSYIFHLAAQTLVTRAYEDPYGTLGTNIMGTVNLLEVMRENRSIKGMIFASSDKAYGKTKQAYTESSPLQGDHPYDVSKSAADMIAQTYYKTYKIPVVITRFGNVYGEGDAHWDRLVPGICRTVIKNEEFEIRSDGKYIRDYVYVKDVVEGYMTLFRNIDSIHGQAYNFSSSDTLSVLDVLKKAEEALHVRIPYKILNTAQNEIPYQHLDDTKIRSLGWKSIYRMEKVFPQILDWYKMIL